MNEVPLYRGGPIKLRAPEADFPNPEAGLSAQGYLAHKKTHPPRALP